MAASYRKAPLLESLLILSTAKFLRAPFFEEHLRTAASENMFMKLRKIKI